MQTMWDHVNESIGTILIVLSHISSRTTILSLQKKDDADIIYKKSRFFFKKKKQTNNGPVVLSLNWKYHCNVFPLYLLIYICVYKYINKYIYVYIYSLFVLFKEEYLAISRAVMMSTGSVQIVALKYYFSLKEKRQQNFL